jgi:hypothetical protein
MARRTGQGGQERAEGRGKRAGEWSRRWGWEGMRTMTSSMMAATTPMTMAAFVGPAQGTGSRKWEKSRSSRSASGVLVAFTRSVETTRVVTVTNTVVGRMVDEAFLAALAVGRAATRPTSEREMRRRMVELRMLNTQREKGVKKGEGMRVERRHQRQTVEESRDRGEGSGLVMEITAVKKDMTEGEEDNHGARR